MCLGLVWLEGYVSLYWNFIRTHLKVVQLQKQQCVLRTEMFPGLHEYNAEYFYQSLVQQGLVTLRTY